MNLRSLFRRGEKRDLGTSSVSFPVDPLAMPAAVSEDGALRLAPVLAAGRLLASTISGMPLSVYREVGDERRRITTPALLRQPCAQGTLHDWIFRAVTSLAYRGNAVGVITARDYLEYPTRIEWLDPANVRCEDQLQLTPLGDPGSFTNPKWYYLGEQLPAEDVVHIPWFQLPGRVFGLSPIGKYALTVSTGLAAQRFSDDWYRAGGVPPGRFRNATQEVTQGQANEIKRRLVQAIRTHEPLVYGRDWEYEPFVISPNEAQFVQTMRLTSSTIASIYGIPPEMIGGETGGSYEYSSAEQRQLEFIQTCLLPWLALLESHLSALLPRGQYVKFDPDVLIRADIKTRFEVYRTAREIGFDNIDGLRRLEDLEPLPDGTGQDYAPLKASSTQAPAAAPAGGDEDRGLRLVRTQRRHDHG